jgi:ankyrin repeat protein
LIDLLSEQLLPEALLRSLRAQGYSGPEELNPTVSTGWTPLTYAVSIGLPEIVRELLELGADPNLPCTEEGRPALFYVSFAGRHQFELVNDLISFGADLHYVDRKGLNPTTFAMAHHESRLVAFLLSLGGEVSSGDTSGGDPVFEVIEKAVEGLPVLLRRGVSALAVDYQGNNLFHALAQSHSFSHIKPAAAIRIFALLLDHGVNPKAKNYQGDTPLHLVGHGSLGAFLGQWLCRQSIEIDARNDSGATPLMVAASHNSRLAKTLLDQGANPLAVNRMGVDVLMASLARFSSASEMLSLIVSQQSKGLDALSSATSHRMGWEDPSGKLSHHVVGNGLCEKLLMMGASPKTVARSGATALMRAARFQPELVPLLIEAGADVNARDRAGWTALMCAAASHRAEVAVEPLLQAGAHVSQATEKKSVARLWQFNPAAQAFLDAARLSTPPKGKNKTGSARRL